MSQKIKPRLLLTALSLALLVVLIYTRSVNLSWGLPYPLHPDERNIANAVQSLKCAPIDLKNNLKNCLNPHFFAYGQFPIYLAFILVQLTRFFTRITGEIQFNEAVIALRYISVIASLFTVQFSLKLFSLLRSMRNKDGNEEESNGVPWHIAALLFIFSPGFIQFAHFGTTESLLMLFSVLITYLSTLIISQKDKKFAQTKTIIFLGIVQGFALGTKLSSGLFLITPALALLHRFISLTIEMVEDKKTKSVAYLKVFLSALASVMLLLALTLSFALVSSPHNLISLPDYLSSMRYESDVALGIAKVFYTRSFFETTPVLFHMIHVFPYVLGMGVFMLFLLGFLLLSWNPAMILLRLSFLIFFLFSTTIYAKWTRFVTPVLPHMIIIGALCFSQLYEYMNKKIDKRLSTVLVIGALMYAILPGLAYLSVYTHPDVRITASRWMRVHIQKDAEFLQETANVVDLPIFGADDLTMIGQIHNTSFNFYDLDTDIKLQEELAQDLQKADYIVVPSRRIFKNHTCLDPLIHNGKPFLSDLGFSSTRCSDLAKMYPKLNAYYRDLFNGSLGYRLVATFTSYPHIEVMGKTLLSYPDEDAEETWTVFDHPVVRVYEKTR